MSERVYDIGDLIEDFDLESQFGGISYRDLVHGKYSIIFTFGNALEPCATTDIGKCRFHHSFFPLILICN